MNTTLPPPPTETTLSREVALIKSVVARAYSVEVKAIDGPSRVKPLPEIRHLAMTLSRTILKASYPEIAAIFRRGNHCTVMNAVKRTLARCDAGDGFLEKWNRLDRVARNAVNISRVKEVV